MAQDFDSVIGGEALGRHLAAARGYCLKNKRQFAAMLQVGSYQTITRWEEGRIPPRSRAGIIEEYMAISGLPREFFEIGFDQLPALVHGRRTSERDEATGIDWATDAMGSLDEAPDEAPPRTRPQPAAEGE